MSFLKQLLTPFVEFEDEKKKQANQQANQTAAPAKPAAAKPAASVPAVDENPEHPLITGAGKTTSAPPPPIPSYSPSGTMTGPLPEHVQYFERLIDEANAKNPLFQGTD